MIRVIVALYFVLFKAVLRLYQKVYIYMISMLANRVFLQLLHSVDNILFIFCVSDQSVSRNDHRLFNVIGIITYCVGKRIFSVFK